MFSGTIGRKRYAIGFVFWALASILGGYLASALGLAGKITIGTQAHMIATILAYVAVVVGSIIFKSSLMVRRMRDINFSPYFILIFWVIVLISIKFTASSQGVGLNANFLTIAAFLAFEPLLFLRRGIS